MKFSNLILLSAVLLAGCATKSTPQSRQHERAAAYAGLTPEQRSLVDSGQIKAGLSMDAVYIAWGSPGQVTRGGNESGEVITWLYYGGYVQETRFWERENVHYAYDPRTYVRAQVLFVNGIVKSWQTFPEPQN
jgi:hypothetical protein